MIALNESIDRFPFLYHLLDFQLIFVKCFCCLILSIDLKNLVRYLYLLRLLATDNLRAVYW